MDICRLSLCLPIEVYHLGSIAIRPHVGNSRIGDKMRAWKAMVKICKSNPLQQSWPGFLRQTGTNKYALAIIVVDSVLINHVLGCLKITNEIGQVSAGLNLLPTAGEKIGTSKAGSPGAFLYFTAIHSSPFPSFPPTFCPCRLAPYTVES